jgi:Domain of unknown function (DUF4194)
VLQRQNMEIPKYAPLLIKLLQSIVYDDDKATWNDIMAFQHQIRTHFAVMGIELILNEQEGFAYLSQPDQIEGEPAQVPRLVRRMPISYEVTLLCVVLREALEEFDIKNTDARKLFLTNKDIKDRIELFFGDRTDKVKLLERLDNYINTAGSLGFLKEIEVRSHDTQNKTYEVRRVLKSKINNAKLEEIRAKMQ